MAETTTERIIDAMVHRIVDQFAPDKIILFGSQARGTANLDSDADLMVVMRVIGSKRKKAAEIDLALMGMGLPKDILVVTPEEVEQYRNIAGTIVYTAMHEGRLLYERAA